MVTIPAGRLAQVFVEVADTLADEFDTAEFLHMLALRVADLVNASAVGILMADRKGQLQFIAASDESAKVVEIFQANTNDGPCPEAYRTGKPVVNADLHRADPRWPRFAAQATAAGFSSVHAFPLRLRDQLIGAMNVFSHQTGGPLDESDTLVVQALADVAAIGLVQKRTINHGEALTDQLQQALNSRVVIEQAKGAIANAQQVSVDVAFGILRSYARNHHRQLSALAHAVVTNSAMLDELIEDVTPPGGGANRGSALADQRKIDAEVRETRIRQQQAQAIGASADQSAAREPDARAAAAAYGQRADEREKYLDLREQRLDVREASLARERARFDEHRNGVETREQKADERDIDLESRRAQLDERQFSIDVQEWMTPPSQPDSASPDQSRSDPGEP